MTGLSLAVYSHRALSPNNIRLWRDLQQWDGLVFRQVAARDGYAFVYEAAAPQYQNFDNTGVMVSVNARYGASLSNNFASYTMTAAAPVLWLPLMPFLDPEMPREVRPGNNLNARVYMPFFVDNSEVTSRFQLYVNGEPIGFSHFRTERSNDTGEPMFFYSLLFSDDNLAQEEVHRLTVSFDGKDLGLWGYFIFTFNPQLPPPIPPVESTPGTGSGGSAPPPPPPSEYVVISYRMEPETAPDEGGFISVIRTDNSDAVASGSTVWRGTELVLIAEVPGYYMITDITINGVSVPPDDTDNPLPHTFASVTFIADTNPTDIVVHAEEMPSISQGSALLPLGIGIDPGEVKEAAAEDAETADPEAPDAAKPQETPQDAPSETFLPEEDEVVSEEDEDESGSFNSQFYDDRSAIEAIERSSRGLPPDPYDDPNRLLTLEELDAFELS